MNNYMKVLKRKPKGLVKLESAIKEFGIEHKYEIRGTTTIRNKINEEFLVKNNIPVYKMSESNYYSTIYIPEEFTDKARTVIIEEVNKWKEHYSESEKKAKELLDKQREYKEILKGQLYKFNVPEDEIKKLMNSFRKDRDILLGVPRYIMTILGLKIYGTEYYSKDRTAPGKLLIVRDVNQSKVVSNRYFPTKSKVKSTIIQSLFNGRVIDALNAHQEIKRQGDLYFTKPTEEDLQKMADKEIKDVQNYPLDRRGSHLFTGRMCTINWITTAYRGIVEHKEHPELNINDKFWIMSATRNGRMSD